MDSEAEKATASRQADDPPESETIAVKSGERPEARDGRSAKYDADLSFKLLLLMIPSLVSVGWVTWLRWRSAPLVFLASVLAATVLVLWLRRITKQTTRQLQTLASVISALREEDYSLRARGADRMNSVGDLTAEINALADKLQKDRGVAGDALRLANSVMEAMATPLLAFGMDTRLRLFNPAAESAFRLDRNKALGQPAQSVALDPLFALSDGSIYTEPGAPGLAAERRWSVRRSRFRLEGVPHELFVLADIRAALREEERVAWQRLIRVLSHEINNSLTPIKSVAGSLSVTVERQAGVDGKPPFDPKEVIRGLQLIENRASSLHQFLQAYQQLARLPAARPTPVFMADLVQRVVSLESRVEVRLWPGPPVTAFLDPAQIEQMLINLLRNAVEASMSMATVPFVSVRWILQGRDLVITIEDNGPGLTNAANLFVPFYTTKPQGSGIGLALAKQIATGHGGTITLENRQPETGCLVTVRMPLRCELPPGDTGLLGKSTHESS